MIPNLTGSRYYGFPHSTSDYDIIVRKSRDEMIRRGWAVKWESQDGISMHKRSDSVTLNAIVCKNLRSYVAMMIARLICKSCGIPFGGLTRKSAVAIHKAVWYVFAVNVYRTTTGGTKLIATNTNDA